MSLIPERLRNVARRRPKVEIGWCELVDLPTFGLANVPAKMDSGAATSAIHASRIKPLARDGELWVEFWFRTKAGDKAKRYEARVVDQRMVRSSNGERQERYVIEAQLCLGKLCWNGELTLANRRAMTFPILVGRQALKKGFLVNSARRWMLGRGHDVGHDENGHD